MRQLTLEELKERELNLLIKIRDFCNQEGLRYYLCAGTLLGAIRHKGFIPWDDDIDIAMPRPDYDRLVELYLAGKCDIGVKLLCVQTEPKYAYTFAKVWDADTLIIEKVGNRNQVELGVHIDIFPMDGYGKDEKEAIKNFKKTHLSMELLVAYNWKKFSRSRVHTILYEPARLILFLLSRFINSEKTVKKLESYYRAISFDESEYTSTIMSSYRANGIIPKKIFDGSIMVEFEGEMFSAPIGYHELLEQCYGNYMLLPPENKRQTHHTFDAYSKD